MMKTVVQLARERASERATHTWRGRRGCLRQAWRPASAPGASRPRSQGPIDTRKGNALCAGFSPLPSQPRLRAARRRRAGRARGRDRPGRARARACAACPSYESLPNRQSRDCAADFSHCSGSGLARRAGRALGRLFLRFTGASAPVNAFDVVECRRGHDAPVRHAQAVRVRGHSGATPTLGPHRSTAPLRTSGRSPSHGADRPRARRSS